MFVAYASTRKILPVFVLMAAISVIGTINMVLAANAPWWARVWGLAVVAPLAFWCVLMLRQMLSRKPALVADATGLLWRRWSETPIPWSAIGRWQDRRYLGARQFTLWLKEPAAHPGKLVNSWLAWGNRGLGFGDVTFSAGGTDRSDTELREVLVAYLGPPAAAGQPRRPAKKSRPA